MSRLTPAASAIVVFLAAAAVLMLEILAARLMAPYVGVSLNTYTGIIGTVLAGISAGTWLGGQAADRFGPEGFLGPILVIGGLLALATGPLVTLLGERVQGASLLAIVVLSGATVFLPALVLSAVTPAVVKMQLRDLSATGRVVGHLSAVATAGALVGTYGSGFVLVARFPTRTITASIGVILMVVGAAVWWRLGRRVAPTAAAALALAIAVTGTSAVLKDGPCKVESGYFCISVISNADGSFKLLRLDDLIHSAVDLREPRELGLPYADVLAAAIDSFARPGARISALHVGGGAFALPRYIAAVRPGSTNTVLEIDQAVVDTARRDFEAEKVRGLRVRVGDARVLLDDEASDKYDFVVGDAYSSRAAPWHLTTREFLVQLEEVLKPRGAYLMNVIDDKLRFVRAEAATMRQVFRYVVLFRSKATTNQILVGSNAPVDAAEIASRAARRNAFVVPIAGARLEELIDDARLLEDDFAPVDQLLN